MKLRKLIALTLALLLVLGLAACSSGRVSTSGISSGAAPLTSDADSEPDKSEPTGDSETTDDPEAAATPEPTPEPVDVVPLSENIATVEETVLVDLDECKVTLKSYDPDGRYGVTFLLLVENFTDSEMSFSVYDSSVNGVMCSSYTYVTIDANTSEDVEADYYPETLSEVGVVYPEDILWKLYLHKADDYTDEATYFLDCVSFSVSNTTTEPSVVPLTPEDGFVTKVLFESDEARVTVFGFDFYGYYGPQIILLCENFTDDRTLMFSISDATVNGIEFDPYWANTVLPNSKHYSQVDWDADDTAEKGITSFSEITLSMWIYNSDDWSEDYILYDDQVFTYTF